MDPTQNTQTPTPAQPAATVQPVQQPTGAPAAQPAPVHPPNKGGSKMAAIIVTILLVLVVLGASAYFYFMQKSQQPAYQPQKTVQNPTPQASPTPTLSADEKAVQSVDAGDSNSSDLKDVQKDVNSL